MFWVNLHSFTITILNENRIYQKIESMTEMLIPRYMEKLTKSNHCLLIKIITVENAYIS